MKLLLPVWFGLVSRSKETNMQIDSEYDWSVMIFLATFIIFFVSSFPFRKCWAIVRKSVSKGLPFKESDKSHSLLGELSQLVCILKSFDALP